MWVRKLVSVSADNYLWHSSWSPRSSAASRRQFLTWRRTLVHNWWSGQSPRGLAAASTPTSRQWPSWIMVWLSQISSGLIALLAPSLETIWRGLSSFWTTPCLLLGELARHLLVQFPKLLLGSLVWRQPEMQDLPRRPRSVDISLRFRDLIKNWFVITYFSSWFFTSNQSF